MKQILAVLCILFCAPASHAADAKLTAQLQSFDAFYRAQLQQQGIVGSSLAILSRGQILDRQNYGTADLERNLPVDDQTIYHWASITKTFTGIAIMQLRDHGRLKLDDPVTQYIPELMAVHNPFGKVSEITIRQLLSHTAGFRSSTWPWGDKPWMPFEPQSWSQIAAMLPYTEIEFAPGSKFQYSNLGVVFLGRIIELLSHDDYEVYIDKNILKPLEMYHSYFDTTPYFLLKHRSHSYRRRDGKLIPGVFDADTGITVANGGLNSPIPDMLKYLAFLVGDPAKGEIYYQILARASLEEMWKPTMSIPLEGESQNRTYAVGLSFFIERVFGQHYVGHSGYQNAFTTHLYVQPESRTGYLVAYNTYTSSSKDPAENTDALDRRVKEFLMEKVFPLTHTSK